MWFTKLVAPFVKKLRRWGYLVLAYLEYFLIFPSPIGRLATKKDCAIEREKLGALMNHLGLKRQVEKLEWIG